RETRDLRRRGEDHESRPTDREEIYSSERMSEHDNETTQPDEVSAEETQPEKKTVDVDQLFSTRTKWGARLVIAVLLLGGIVWFVPPVYKLFGTVEVKHWHRTRGEINLTVGPGGPTWISLDRISKHALHAIIVAEDARFYEHRGLDFAE